MIHDIPKSYGADQAIAAEVRGWFLFGSGFLIGVALGAGIACAMLTLSGCSSTPAPNGEELLHAGIQIGACQDLARQAKAHDAGNAEAWAAYDACMQERGLRGDGGR